jgi:hypothetical protein
MSDAGEIVGMVDVLKLTYATLDQVRHKIRLAKQKLISALDQFHVLDRWRGPCMEQVLDVS